MPVFFAGGALGSDEELFSLTREAARLGGAGLCVGRNVFQRNQPQEILTRLGQILMASNAVSPRNAMESFPSFPVVRAN